MMEMLVTLYVPRTAPLAAALEGKAAQGTQRDVRGGLPGTPCAVCREQGCGQKDMHAEARADCAGRPAGNESARGALGRADEGADGMRSGVHREARADCAGRPAGNENVRGVCAADGPEARAKKRAEVRRMARALEQANARYERDYAAALCAIEAIEDAALRCAVQLSCLEGMRWEAVADELGATGDAWRKRVERWLAAWEKAGCGGAGRSAGG